MLIISLLPAQTLAPAHHKEDWSASSSNSIKTIWCANHHCQRSKIQCCEQVHLPCQFTVAEYHHHIYDEMNVLIALTRASFERLQANICNRKGISLETADSAQSSCASHTALCLWNLDCLLTPRKANTPFLAQPARLRNILNIKWWNKPPDTEFPTQAVLPSIHIILMQSQPRWVVMCFAYQTKGPPREVSTASYNNGSGFPESKEALQRYSEGLLWSVQCQPRDLTDMARVIHEGAKTCKVNRTAAAEQWRLADKSSC